MEIMNPFKQKMDIVAALKSVGRKSEPERPDTEVSCPECGQKMRRSQLKDNLYVCPFCNKHLNISARFRIKSVADANSFHEICGSIKGDNPLDFPGYDEKLKDQQRKSGLKEAVLTGTAKIGGIKCVVCVMDNRFLMGSMGTAVGEKITRSFEYATKKKLPIIVFCTSGGARMQEGILSLFQMAKTSAAVERHNRAGLLYISVMTNPTTGGVTASFASLGDIILAEPGALIGFAGPRVIEQTIGQSLPEGFQTAEYLLEHGFVDAVVQRTELKERLTMLLKLHDRRK